MQDRKQKADALLYAVQKRWFPQLELDLIAPVTTASSARALTDIDVLACIPNQFDGFHYLLIDCKTRKKESPISRFFWLRGVMDHFDAAHGMCLFARPSIEPDHRYMAAQQKVTLLTEDEFSLYRTVMLQSRNQYDRASVADIDRWDAYFSIPQRYPKLTDAITFAKSGFWMCQSEAEACRKTIVELAKHRPELDPGKREHWAIFFDLGALFAQALARLVSRLFSLYLQPANREQLSEALLFLLYSGKENYEHLNSLKRMITAPALDPDRSLTLPNWDGFLQLARSFLDAPMQVSMVPLILREIAFSYLGEEQMEFAAFLSIENRQAGKFALLCTEYLARAARLPPEFLIEAQSVILSLQHGPRITLPLGSTRHPL